MAKIILGIERIRCPRCRRENLVEIHTDLPPKGWLVCGYCGKKGLIFYGPMLDKYGLIPGLSRPERRSFSKHLKKDIAKIN